MTLFKTANETLPRPLELWRFKSPFSWWPGITPIICHWCQFFYDYNHFVLEQVGPLIFRIIAFKYVILTFVVLESFQETWKYIWLFNGWKWKSGVLMLDRWTKRWTDTKTDQRREGLVDGEINGYTELTTTIPMDKVRYALGLLHRQITPVLVKQS